MLRIRLQWLCFWLFLAPGLTGLAQGLDEGEYPLGQGGSLPAWVVPVLKLVSATHVEPTTGVVLSDTGLVLVPEDFASAGDEIIVLDGGTDIIRNGRPARLERKFTADGIQVLAVQGLGRQGASIAFKPLEDGDELRLAAFPPAELIAEGKPPLNVTASVAVFKENGKPAISGDTPLPNVTGPLLDSCGDLAGFSMADDIQSMDASPATRYAWRAAVLNIFETLQIVPRESNCANREVEKAQTPEPVIEEPEPEEPPDAEPEPAVEEEEEEPAQEPDPEPELELDTLPPFEKDIAQPPPEEAPASSGWPWIIAALVLIGLGLILHWFRRAQRTGVDETTLESGSDIPVSDAGENETIEEPGTPDALDSLLVVEGVLSDGADFRESCAVSKNAINVLVGRGDADLVIDSVAVSRHHASLNGTADELTLSDLGSSNGSSINGVPCLEGEIMFIEPGDSIVLGDARFTFQIRPRPAAGSSNG
jgi:hypothetical protein